jgi:hypothetical protein
MLLENYEAEGTDKGYLLQMYGKFEILFVAPLNCVDMLPRSLH